MLSLSHLRYLVRCNYFGYDSDYCYHCRYFVEEKSIWEEEGGQVQNDSVEKHLNTVDASIAQYTGGYILVIVVLNYTY